MSSIERTESYLALIDAIQHHIRTVDGEDYYARDWVLTCGVEHITGPKDAAGMIRLERSPRSTPYTVTGLLGWALDCYHPTDID